MKKLLLILVMLWGAGAIGIWYWNDTQTQLASFRTVAVKRGDLLATIEATGTLEPEEVVDVGAQIAGEIKSFGQDPREPGKSISYGSHVEEGTILAQLNDSLLRARVNQAKASLARVEAEQEKASVKLKQAEREFDRAQRLRDRNSIPSQEFDAAMFERDGALANMAVVKGDFQLAQANLEEAQVNLGYATIKSPVKGVILDRRVNIGQTVIASLNAPSLFLIAKDLSRIEVWASVNETDVGAIHHGQGVRFTVGAFPDETFRGKVSQIRLNASMTQSVVTYTVVVQVDNAGGKLLPYLTARLQFEVEDRTGVLLVPNAALRWQPKVHQVSPEARPAFSAALRQRALGNKTEKPRSLAETEAGIPGTLWVKSDEFVRPIEVRAGLTDGAHTEIVSGKVDEGTEIVLGLSQQANGGDGASPFLPNIKNDKAKK